MRELREQIAQRDEEEQELSRGSALLIAQGNDPSDLREDRVHARQVLQDLHAAIPTMEHLVDQAQEALQAARADVARELYAKAREDEARAAERVEEAMEPLVLALADLREAGRDAYRAGLDSGLETSLQYKRRLSVRETFVLTKLSAAVPSFHIRNAHRVEDLTARLESALPPLGESTEPDESETAALVASEA